MLEKRKSCPRTQNVIDCPMLEKWKTDAGLVPNSKRFVRHSRLTTYQVSWTSAHNFVSYLHEEHKETNQPTNKQKWKHYSLKDWRT